MELLLPRNVTTMPNAAAAAADAADAADAAADDVCGDVHLVISRHQASGISNCGVFVRGAFAINTLALSHFPALFVSIVPHPKP
jgi:hypothetical protein